MGFYQDTLGRFDVGEGDVVFSRKGKVGFARPHPPNLQPAMTHTLCVLKPNRNQLTSRYLLLLTRSSPFISSLTRTMNPNVGVPTLGLSVIRDTVIPLPPTTEQRRIVAYLDDLQAQVDDLKKLQEETVKELDALLPSILSKAFAGQI